MAVSHSFRVVRAVECMMLMLRMCRTRRSNRAVDIENPKIAQARARRTWFSLPSYSPPGMSRAASTSPSPTERTPLVSPPKADQALDNRPLPRFQVALLCLSRAVEGLAFFTIFPYAN